MLDVQFSTLITASGTFILGLSWLIGSTAQEVLSSIIFVFIKHPWVKHSDHMRDTNALSYSYDIGDRVDIDALNLKVMHMDLVSLLAAAASALLTLARSFLPPSKQRMARTCK